MANKNNSNQWITFFLILLSALMLFIISTNLLTSKREEFKKNRNGVNISYITNTPSISPQPPPPSPTPTPKPLTFAEMNRLYGPCTKTPVFMYHHVQSKQEAVNNKQTSLTTYTDIFEEQLIYLQSRGYQTIDIGTLIGFLKGENQIPQKSVILTFDDGYTDFFEVAYLLLRKYNFKAIVFLPTGLINNYGYLTWPEITEMGSSGLVYFGNHTWSHYAVIKNETKITEEIKTADLQLSEKSLNDQKVFAYPYGTGSAFTQELLQTLNYNLAFTTNYGTILCAKNSLSLPRVRAGNLLPSHYGL